MYTDLNDIDAILLVGSEAFDDEFEFGFDGEERISLDGNGNYLVVGCPQD